ncbi:MAG: hypothetical protein ACHQXA_08895 [Gemmatimonadales bacterium]
MTQIPPCSSLGPQCRALTVTLRVGGLQDGVASLDDEATWLLGHTQNIAFGRVWQEEQSLFAEATLQVPCRYLREGAGEAACTAHGYSGPLPAEPVEEPARRRLGGDKFEVVDGLALTPLSLPVAPVPAGLPLYAGENPCLHAPCRTADNVRGAACCRDLQLGIVCHRSDVALEALVRARRSPYLCKVDRESDRYLGVEMISACAYLDDDGRNCSLHGRTRADGRAAKPGLCFDWPDGEVYHTGCVFKPVGQAVGGGVG